MSEHDIFWDYFAEVVWSCTGLLTRTHTELKSIRLCKSSTCAVTFCPDDAIVVAHSFRSPRDSATASVEVVIAVQGVLSLICVWIFRRCCRRFSVFLLPLLEHSLSPLSVPTVYDCNLLLSLCGSDHVFLSARFLAPILFLRHGLSRCLLNLILTFLSLVGLFRWTPVNWNQLLLGRSNLLSRCPPTIK